MKSYGLLGKSLDHSFSKTYFTEKFNSLGIEATYQNFELSTIDQFASLKNFNKISGFNVTIPYKTEIIPYLDELDPISKKIGAVNTIKIVKGKCIGYNTDYFGFRRSLEGFLKGNKIDNALILGSGGASMAVQKVLNDTHISYRVVSRKGDFNYNSLDQKIILENKLIINTTPLGMLPDVTSSPNIPYQFITENHFLYDLIYNPKETLFLKKGREQSAHTLNGLQMLELQAEKSWEIWNN